MRQKPAPRDPMAASSGRAQVGTNLAIFPKTPAKKGKGLRYPHAPLPRALKEFKKVGLFSKFRKCRVNLRKFKEILGELLENFGKCEKNLRKSTEKLERFQKNKEKCKVKFRFLTHLHRPVTGFKPPKGVIGFLMVAFLNGRV